MGKENIARAILSEQSACDVDVRTIVSFFIYSCWQKCKEI